LGKAQAPPPEIPGGWRCAYPPPTRRPKFWGRGTRGTGRGRSRLGYRLGPSDPRRVQRGVLHETAPPGNFVHPRPPGFRPVAGPAGPPGGPQRPGAESPSWPAILFGPAQHGPPRQGQKGPAFWGTRRRPAEGQVLGSRSTTSRRTADRPTARAQSGSAPPLGPHGWSGGARPQRLTVLKGQAIRFTFLMMFFESAEGLGSAPSGPVEHAVGASSSAERPPTWGEPHGRKYPRIRADHRCPNGPATAGSRRPDFQRGPQWAGRANPRP